MKIKQTIALLSALILVAGCAHEQHQAQYDESVSPNSNATGQNDQSSKNDNGTRNGAESDDVLAAQVRQTLQQDAQIAPLLSNIQISAKNGTVILNGSVPSREQKRQVESVVAGAPDVVVVDDNLKVSGAMNPTSRSDSGSSIYSNGKMNDPEGNQPATPTANGGDNSVNGAPVNNQNNVRLLNPTSNNTNSSPRIYHDAAGGMNAATNNALSPTSRTNGENQIYQQNENQTGPALNTNGNNKIP